MINKNEISKKIEMAKELADKYELASLSNDFEMLLQHQSMTRML